jgi:hypothetical protein
MEQKTPYDEIATRTHPEYASFIREWLFYRSTYNGGRAWFKDNIFKYFKEGPDEYEERVERAYRANYTREVVDLINKYIFKADVARSEDAEPYIQDFWKNTTLQRRDIDHFMNIACKGSSIYGRVWIVVDSNATDKVKSVADKKKAKARVYAYTLNPDDVLDLAYGVDGELEWVKVREFLRDDADPFSYSGEIKTQVRLWTRNAWYLFAEMPTDKDDLEAWDIIDQGIHGLGIVPVTYLDHNESEDNYTSTSLIADIAYLDKAAANYRSNLDAIIQDQTFSQLVIPSEALTTVEGDDLAEKLLEFGTKRVFLYASGETNAAPEYIAPDPKQAGVIISVLNKIITEIYSSVGMGGERTKEDNATGIDNSSGVAKAYDFERMNSLLSNKAKALEYCENRMIRIVRAWNKALKDTDEVKNYVTYSKDFDVRNLADEFDIANNLAIIDGPKTLRQQQMNSLVDKLYPQLKAQLRLEIEKDINEEWLKEPTPEEIAEQAYAESGGDLAKPEMPKGNGSQGQNNKPADKRTSTKPKTAK